MKLVVEVTRNIHKQQILSRKSWGLFPKRGDSATGGKKHLDFLTQPVPSNKYLETGVSVEMHWKSLNKITEMSWNVGMWKVTCFLEEVHKCPENMIGGGELLGSIYICEGENHCCLLDNIRLKELSFPRSLDCSKFSIVWWSTVLFWLKANLLPILALHMCGVTYREFFLNLDHFGKSHIRLLCRRG